MFFSFLITIFYYSFPQNDHLRPAFPSKDGYSFYDSICEKHFNKWFDIRFISAPSWGHISAFSLKQKDKEYILKTNTVHYAGKDTRKTGLHCIKLNETYYRSSKRMIKTTLKQIDFPEENDAILDGTRYYFAAPNERNNLKIGMTHPPKENSLMRHLSQLCDSICLTQSIADLPDIRRFEEMTRFFKQTHGGEKPSFLPSLTVSERCIFSTAPHRIRYSKRKLSALHTA